MGKPRRTAQAKVDLLEIWCHIGEDSPDAADRTVAGIDDAIKLVSEHPGFGTERPDLAAGLRLYPVGSYLIGYRQAKGGVQILRVVHGARDLPSLKWEGK